MKYIHRGEKRSSYKKLLTTVFVVQLLASCAETKELRRSVIFSGYDFSPYTAKGFLFSPEQYLDPHEAIGIIKLSITPETTRTPEDVSDKIRYRLIELGKSDWYIEEVDQAMILEEAYKQATKMGADAIVRFGIEVRPLVNGSLIVPTYEVTGFAIKRTLTSK